MADNDLYAALKVIAEDDRIANWLAENDPKALAQANAAMSAYEDANDIDTSRRKDFIVKDLGILMVRVENADDEQQAIDMATEWYKEQNIEARLEDAIDSSDFYIHFTGEWEVEED